MPPSSEVKSEDGSTGHLDLGDGIDAAAFEQILDMDDEDDDSFSKSIVYDFFTQFEEKISEAHTALKDKDLNQLSQLGHFLKGSSATLGLVKVRDHCEKLQNIGALRSPDGIHEVKDKDKCLEQCRERITLAERDFREVEKVLRKFYHDDGEK